jgi:hypothetical protein
MDVLLDGRPVTTLARGATIEATRRVEQGRLALSRVAREQACDRGLSFLDRMRAKRRRRNARRGSSA